MKLDNELSYTIEVMVSVNSGYYQKIIVDVIAKSKLDAFATAKEVITYMYNFTEDSILEETLLEEKPVYRFK